MTHLQRPHFACQPKQSKQQKQTPWPRPLPLLLLLLALAACATEPTPTFTITTDAAPSDGGTVTYAPAGSPQDKGSQITFTATPAQGYLFSQWQGDLNGDANPASLTLVKDVAVTAVFERKTYPLTITIAGEGTVAERIVQAKTTDYAHGTVVELTAVGADGWMFSGWGGDLGGSSNPAQITVESNMNVTAIFEQVPMATLTVTARGCGSVDITGGQYRIDEEVVITATPDPGCEFHHWSDGTYRNPHTITMTGDIALEAIFIPRRENRQEGRDQPAVTFKRIAVIPVVFPDTPDAYRDAFPTRAQIDSVLTADFMKDYLETVSYGVFDWTLQVFDYVMFPIPAQNEDRSIIGYEQLATADYTVPGFDAADFDLIALVPTYDQIFVVSGLTTMPTFTVNGQPVPDRTHFFAGILKGHIWRDTDGFYVDHMELTDGHCVEIGDNYSTTCPQPFDLPYSGFQRVFLHEMVHSLGIFAHANSRTNGERYEHEEEIADNRFYDRSLMNLEYGNTFDLMGYSLQSMSLNAVFRDYLGWHRPANRLTINGYGSHTITLHDLNDRDRPAYVEIRMPNQVSEFSWLDRKNHGYVLEVRSSAAPWDAMLEFKPLKGNTDGVMILKTDGFGSQLLDASPSRNFSNSAGYVTPDLRDVALKPGMVYENDEIKFHNVVRNADGSITLDVVIK